MSILTKVLNLFCYDPETDGNLTFNVTEALTKNWEKIDQLVLLAVAAAAAYDPEGSYAVGDYCTHGGGLHKCNTPIPSGEAWTAEHWTETTVAAELAGKATATPPQEYSLPLAEGITENQPCTYHKNQFNEVTIHFNGQGAITEAMLLGTLPEGFRPAKIYDIPAVYRTADGYHAGGIVLWANGTITTHISIPSAIGCIFSASFIATS